jgi:hypothetical protein
MIRSDPAAVVRKVFFDDPRAQCHRSQNRGMTWRMVRKTQDQVRIHAAIGVQHPEIDVLEVLQATGIVGIALHQHQVRVDGKNRIDRPLDIADGGCSGG